MADSFGLIDNAGTVRNSSGDFTARKLARGYYRLEFLRDVRFAVVVASARNLLFCDNAGVGVTVCNEHGQRDHLGFMFDDPGDQLGFSFVLLDGEPVEGGD